VYSLLFLIEKYFFNKSYLSVIPLFFSLLSFFRAGEARTMIGAGATFASRSGTTSPIAFKRQGWAGERKMERDKQKRGIVAWRGAKDP
jgi:hypothetical protein